VPVADEDVARLRVALTRVARRIDRQISGAGLTRTELSILAAVSRFEQVGLTELAEYEDVNPTMLSRIVGKLTEQGLLRRLPDPSDRRASRVELTAKGQRLQQSLRDQRSKLFAERLRELPDDIAQTLVGATPALEALVDWMCGPTAAPKSASRSRGQAVWS
jgi:DNA-binding MarR family transcriptional regulator